MPSLHADVLVGGAGPAGSTAAIWAARAGYDVLLVDMARFPRDKTCGDGLTPRAMVELERLGLSEWIRQHPITRGLEIHGWATVVGTDPTRLAIVRHNQCVGPGGFVVVVSLTISATVSSLIEGLRPRPSRILPSPTSPSKAESLRRARTVTGVTPTSSAITVLANLSAAINNTRARNTRRCGAN